MNELKIKTYGKCPYCGAPNTTKINETEFLCNHCGQVSSIDNKESSYLTSDQTSKGELEKTIKYLVNISKPIVSQTIKFSKNFIRKLKDYLFIAIKNLKAFKERWKMIDSGTKAILIFLTIVVISVWISTL
jgi:hypothetical protein